MRINTKAVFEWDGTQYIETYNEGYEYEGPMALAEDWEDTYGGENRQTQDSQTDTTTSTGPSLASMFGVDITGYTNDGEKDLFTEISDGLKKGSKKGTYDSFFQMQQKNAENSFLSSTGSIGQTKDGNAYGFAGSTADDISMRQRKDAFAQASVKSEEAVQNKMSEAKSVMASIEKGNRSTLLQLKDMRGEYDEEEDDGSMWICSRIKKEGVVSSRESLKMTRFFVKFLFAHPAVAELYITHALELIKKADEDGFDWRDESLKHYFITNVLSLSDKGEWELAYKEYFDAYMDLCALTGMDISYDNKLWDMGIFGSIKYWIRMFQNRVFRSVIGKMVYVSYRIGRA
tara:strand:- start:1746 stop:2780 length:1035 start_codon:yes stop_codon:yes gene_type:complete